MFFIAFTNRQWLLKIIYLNNYFFKVWMSYLGKRDWGWFSVHHRDCIDHFEPTTCASYGRNLVFLKIHFLLILDHRAKIIGQMDLKKSPICPIWCQSDPLSAKICYPRVRDDTDELFKKNYKKKNKQKKKKKNKKKQGDHDDVREINTWTCLRQNQV